MLLSIIIPIYNAEKSLPHCLDSVLGQLDSQESFEVVCVNDGSSDSSADVVYDYQKRFTNIVLVNQENKGVSTARNIGIAKSTGDYLAFLDSDDELLNGSLSKLIEIIRNSGDDIIVCRIFKNKEELIPWSSLFSSGAQYSAKEMIDFGYLHGTACGCIIKRTFVEDNHIVFPVGVYNGEDGFFFHSCLYFSGYLRFENIRMYNVLGAEGSLSRTYNKERVQRMLSSLRTVEDTLNSYPLNYNRKFILDYIKYSILSGLITATVYTKGTGLVYLLKHNCNHIIKMELDDNVVFLRAKMVLLQRSFVLFYLLAWAKKFLKHFYC